LPSSYNIICFSSGHGIQYVQFLEITEGYINANWIFILVTQSGGAISWKTTKQNVVSWYTMEAKILVVNTSVS